MSPNPNTFILSTIYSFFFFRILPTPSTIHEISSRRKGNIVGEGAGVFWENPRRFWKVWFRNDNENGREGRKEGRKERNGRSNCQGTSRVPNLRFVRAYARGTPQLPKSESAQPLRAPLSPSLNVPRRPESARRIVPATSPFQRSLQTSLLVDSPRSGIYAFQRGRGGEGEDVEEDVRGF